MSVNDSISVTDLNEEDFNNPITLLDAIRRLNLQAISGPETPKEKTLLSVDDIQKKYGLSGDYIRSSILAGAICPAKMDLYFIEEDVRAIAEKSKSLNPLMSAFEKELDKMAMNYSYKPLLLLSLLRDSNYSEKVENVVDFYFEYYKNRIKNGLLPEKSDSSFVQHPNDRLVARRTILRYPAGVFVKKAFVVYEKSSDTLSLNPLLINGNNRFSKEYISRRCYELLDTYYSNLQKNI